jgi:glutamate/tyrosine decarboxylase-like PLP-dependent enzyme
LKVWLSLRYHGLETFRRAIQRDLDHAQALAQMIRDCQDLELLAPIELSAVCFRYRTGDNAFHERLLKRLIRRGKVYISNATIRGNFALRACFVNHRTGDADVRAIIDEVLAAAKEV